MLTRSVETSARPAVQGLNDLAMNMAGAFGGLLAGLVVAWQGFGTLTAAAGALTLPVIVLVLSGRRVAQVIAPNETA